MFSKAKASYFLSIKTYLNLDREGKMGEFWAWDEANNVIFHSVREIERCHLLIKVTHLVVFTLLIVAVCWRAQDLVYGSSLIE